MSSTNIQNFPGDVQIRGTTFIKANTNTENVAIGTTAGEASQGTYTTAVGSAAGSNSQGTNSVAVGRLAGTASQGTNSVAVGVFAGSNAQGASSVAMGVFAGSNAQGESSVAVGNSVGRASQGAQSVAIGYLSGSNSQGATSVAIGSEAGRANQSADNVAIGVKAGSNAQGTPSVAIGHSAASSSQGSRAVAIGFVAGKNSQGYQAIAIGTSAGATSQGTSSIAMGLDAGETSQAANAIAIGYKAGSSNQSQFSVAVGYEAQITAPGSHIRGTCTALGTGAGSVSQEVACTAVGQNAGKNGQKYYAQAFGLSCGQSNQGHSAVAMGMNAGTNSQGVKAVALGNNSGVNGQSGSSVVINAGSATVQGNLGSHRFFIRPLRQDNSGRYLMYNTSTQEVTFRSSDDRLKDDEKPIRNALSTIMKLKPQNYEKRFSLDPQSSTINYESGHMAQDIYYDTPELRHLVSVPDTANPTPDKPAAPSDDPRDDPDYSAWGNVPTDFDAGGMIPWLVRGVQELKRELPRSKTTVSDTWGQNINSLIVSANTNKHKTNTIPLVTLSNVHNDKSWYGVVSNEIVDDTDDYDTLIDIKGDTKIWVVDTNGSLESGDLLTTSNTSPGYAVKQDDDFIRSHTVAKMTQDCDFTEPIQRPVMRKRQQLTDVTYYLKKQEAEVGYSTYTNIARPERRSITTKIVYRKPSTLELAPGDRIFRDTVNNIEVDEEEYDILPESQRSVEYTFEIDVDSYDNKSDEDKVGYTRFEKIIYNKVLIFDSKLQKTSHPFEEIRQELVDVLDENGQITWEETGETEPIYTLVNHGTHKAALVTCKVI
tara:strand:+ start:1186 stop:3651 length:2466 start_codon:yes stop_codon:yes gene_type:complete